MARTSIPIYQVDAFTAELFRGNPAAVCPLEEWLPDAVLQRIAAENNLSETAFFVPRNSEYDIRWFSPVTEVDLCGHATLAAAFVLHMLQPERTRFRFQSKCGHLDVFRESDGLLTLDFPAQPAAPVDPPAALEAGLRSRPEEVWAARRDYLTVFPDESAVAALNPDFARLADLDRLGVIATAPGDEADFVSRFFAPSVGVPEDPVTGSAHCTLVPYWARRLGKARLHARQISSRGGELHCEEDGDRVKISGRAVLYLEGTIRTSD